MIATGGQAVIPVLPGCRRAERLFQEVLPLLAPLAPGRIFRTFPLADAFEGGADRPPEAAIEAVKTSGVAILGHLPSGIAGIPDNPNLLVRRALGVFALTTRARSRRIVPSRYEDVNLIVVREATEDVYAQIEHEVVPGVVESIKVTTEEASRRVFEFAYSLAEREGIGRVTIVHKANIMKRTDGMFLRCGQEVADLHPKLEVEALIADNMAMQLVSAPERYRMLVCGNLFGDLLSDLATGIIGGPLASRVTGHGERVNVHHTILDGHLGVGETSKDPPLHFVVPAISLLRDLGFDENADRLGEAVVSMLDAKDHLTPDLGGTATAREMVDALIARLPG